MRVLSAVGKGLKATVLRWSGWTAQAFTAIAPGSRINFLHLLGGRAFFWRSSVVMAVTLWIARTYPEAPIRFSRRKGDEWEPELEHPLAMLLEQPNPFYSGPLLWMATIIDWILDGNAYWLKQRDGMGRVTGLWWLPAWTIDPKWPDDGSIFLEYYEYTVEGQPYRFEPKDIVHFRYGLDPENPRKGYAPLKAAIREIFTDEEAGNFTASLLRNLGVPGVVMTPVKSDQMMETTQEDLDTAKKLFAEKFGGDKRGEPLMLNMPLDVKVVSWSPEQMNLRDLRRIPEERVTAILGVAAVVCGLGAGLDRSTYNNWDEARKAAYESNLIPTQRLFAADIKHQLLPEFSDPKQYRVDYDYSEIRVLQENQTEVTARLTQIFQAGAMTLDEYRSKLGLGPAEQSEGDVYYIPINYRERRVGELEDSLAPTQLVEGEPVRQLPAPNDEGDEPPDEETEEDEENSVTRGHRGPTLRGKKQPGPRLLRYS